jgi:hypothetical protein
MPMTCLRIRIFWKACLVVLCFVVLGMPALAQHDPLPDVFPLGLDRWWTYTFNTKWTFVAGRYGEDDNGIAQYQIIGKTTLPSDSTIRWRFIRRRTFNRIERAEDGLHGPFRLKDSAYLEMDETPTGYHAISRQTFDPQDAFPFALCLPETLFRYSPTDSAETARFVIDTVGGWCGMDFYRATAILQKNVGLTSSSGSGGGGTLHHQMAYVLQAQSQRHSAFLVHQQPFIATTFVGIINNISPLLFNAGTDTAHISNIIILDTGLVVNDIPSDIPPFESVPFQLSYAPALVGVATFRVVITSSAETSPDTMQIRVEALLPVLAVSPSYIDFGSVAIGDFGSVVVEISNKDVLPHTVTRDVSTLDHSFTIVPDPATVISPGASIHDVIYFWPAAGIEYSSTVLYRAITGPPDEVDTVFVRGMGFEAGGYSLNQNFPNPFNGTTSITLDIASRGNVTLRIYDVLGRTVETLVDEVKAAGPYSVQFDGSRFASGVYFCRLTTNNFTQTRKLVLMH